MGNVIQMKPRPVITRREASKSFPVFIASLKQADEVQITEMGKVRSLYTKEIAAKIRELFRALGIKKVKVAKGKGTGSCYIHVDYPSGPFLMCSDYNEQFHANEADPGVQEARWADKTLKRIILTAFPDLDDRSDSMTDYFDFVFTIGTYSESDGIRTVG